MHSDDGGISLGNNLYQSETKQHLGAFDVDRSFRRLGHSKLVTQKPVVGTYWGEVEAAFIDTITKVMRTLGVQIFDWFK